MASKKSAKKSAAKKSVATKSTAPINEAERREKAVAKAKALYEWDRSAILNLGDASLEANLAELQKLLARRCTTEEICYYLKKLAAWLIWFQYDYTRLRRAVCNVERRAWGGAGDPSLRFCSNGTGSEPADPTPPPIWS